ncbi:cellular tumor antigen p53-like isoform X2 [Zophobas morio]|uniref:cellular tumor antigen p53-like isoform X2 n=1 Tax=Zophobas morio TaxID=2755281 RepID=UPI0030836E04
MTEFISFCSYSDAQNMGVFPQEEEEFKPIPIECFGTADQPYTVPQFPPDQPQDLGTEEYSGPFNFEVLIIPSEQKTPWEYSSKLNKIFIGINLKFPVAFTLTHRPQNLNLYVRATPIFSQSQFFEEPVHRCVAHQHAQDPSNHGLPVHVFQHIIRCTNDMTQYFGDRNSGTRLNIVIPLGRPQTGSDVIKEFYHFVCKNSCPSGMNRKPIDVVFTLENEMGEVFGRRLLSVRICSCPKRDREKEEKDLEKNHPPQAKKRKLVGGSGDGGRREGGGGGDKKMHSVNFNIVGKENYLHILTVARDRMAAEIVNLETKNGPDQAYRKSYNEICSLIDKATTE